MNRSHFACCLLLVAPLALPTPPCRGQTIGMPEGARQWIHLNANDVAEGICCDDAVGGIGSIPDPSPNYVGNPPAFANGARIFACADSSANRLRISQANRRTLNIFL